MEESDKMVALKKAYAEIILNTAKEAAARVMASERKAVKFQQDLGSSKDEALRLLVRLKQMIDAKTIEAEITSSNQQRRIDELEAQLQEAEDIITDLRSELRYVRDKLEKVRSNQFQQPKVKDATGEAVPSETANQEPLIVCNSPSNTGVASGTVLDMRDTQFNQSPVQNKCRNEVKQSDQFGAAQLESCNTHESDLDIIMRNKEPELYRNGCTQRIRALERNVLDGKPPPGDLDDQCASEKNNEESLRPGKIDDPETSVKDKNRRSVLALKAKNTEVMKKASREGMKKTTRGRTLRRRKRRFGKAKASSHRSHTGHLIKTSQPSSILSRCSKISTVNGNDEGSHTQPAGKGEKIDVVKSSKELEEHLQHKSSLYTDDIAIICKGKGKRNMRSLDSIISSFESPDQPAKFCQKSGVPDQPAKPCEQSSIPPPSKTHSNLVSVEVVSGEDKLKVADIEANVKPLTRLHPGLTSIRGNVDPISGSKNVTLSVKAFSRSKPGREKDPASRDDTLSVKPEGPFVENIAGASPKMQPEMVDVPLVYSDLKDTGATEEVSASPSKVDGSRLVMYTFQRKRKKGSFSDTDENNSPVKMKTGEKENTNTQETQNSTLVNEPSRGSRGLAQVARQLISLSGKRW